MNPPLNILVTGASGFIGRASLKALTARGLTISAVSSRTRPTGGASLTWVYADLLDYPTLHRLMREVAPTHLLHLAWFSKPGAFWTSAENLAWLTASTELFRAFGMAGGVRALAIGTCAEYPLDTAVQDGFGVRPPTIYGQTKLAASLALQAAADVYGFSAAWARLFYPYGPGEPRQKLIGSVIGGLLRGKRIACTDGSQVRDMVYEDDVGEALAALLLDEASGIFDIGSGHGTSIRSLVELICTRMGATTDRVDFGARPFPSYEARRQVARVDRLPASTGWRPRVDLDEGIDRTIASHRLQT